MVFSGDDQRPSYLKIKTNDHLKIICVLWSGMRTIIKMFRSDQLRSCPNWDAKHFEIQLTRIVTPVYYTWDHGWLNSSWAPGPLMITKDMEIITKLLGAYSFEDDRRCRDNDHLISRIICTLHCSPSRLAWGPSLRCLGNTTADKFRPCHNWDVKIPGRKI